MASRVTISIDDDVKQKLATISNKQKRSLTATLEYALDVYTALHHADGNMRCSIDSILLFDQLPCSATSNNPTVIAEANAATSVLNNNDDVMNVQDSTTELIDNIQNIKIETLDF